MDRKYRLLSHSAHIFFIEWQDKVCKKVQFVSDNALHLIQVDLYSQADFSRLIPDLKSQLDRDTCIYRSRINTVEMVEVPPYRIKGLKGEDVFVREEIINQDDGHPISFFTDVTLLIQQQELLRSTTERLELVLQGTRLGMWDWNPQTNDVRFDERWADMLGLTLSELSQTLDDWQSRVHPDDINNCFADIQKHINGQTDAYENLHRMKHADGGWRYILDRGRIVERDEEGLPVRFIGTHTDVTDLKEAEHKATLALAARNKFFARISHEIRTPLHGILGTADILRSRELSSDNCHLVNIISESGGLLQTLLDDLLDVAKIQENALVVAIRDVDIMPVVKYVFRLFGQKAQAKGLSFEFDKQLKQREVWVQTDSTRLSQVLSNLLSNAIKFTDQGFVKLSIAKEDSNIWISVTDSGVGIENTDTIFDEYTQEGSDASKNQGTGLGLSIVKNLCQQLNTALNCQSTPGEGTRFAINLGPTVAAKDVTGEEATDDDPRNYVAGYAKVMIVDDNEINLFIAKTMLEDCFKSVFVAMSGKDAIELALQEQDIDIIFMDLNMPEMDGIEASKRIRELALSKQPLIVAQTADATEEAKAMFSETDVTHIITKPFTKAKLVSLFRTLETET